MAEKINKLKKADVDYHESMSSYCGNCKHFMEDEKEEGGKGRETGSCELVAGTIDEDGWCKLWKSRRKPTLAETAAPG